RQLASEDYIALYVPGYRVARFADHHLPPGARILGAGEDLSYYYGRAFVPVSWRGARVDRLRGQQILEPPDGHEVAEKLVRAGYSHLVAVPAARDIGRRFPSAWVTREAFWEAGPRLLYADGSRYLFDAGALQPRVPGAYALDVRPGTEGRVNEEVSVARGTLYALDAELRAGGDLAHAVLRIEWRDARGQAVVASPRREVAVGEGWRRVAMAATAPDRAVTAVVAVEWVGRSRGIMRSVRFYELR
ncbi:MAG: hypothetical protein QN159_02060, partial [Armatimonadota bacterium]|nr:hypothetical protein [Armatimonadota bacterium]